MSKKSYRHRSGNGMFFAPESVGSSARYAFDVYKWSGKRYFNAEFVVSDCDKRVWWSAYGPNGPEHMRQKLEGLLDFVHEALYELDVAERKYEELKTKGRKNGTKKQS